MKLFTKYRLAFYVSVLSGLNSIYAQNYILKHITTRDGLAGEGVTGFTQDDKGFIWIATIGGLQRFDGEQFTTYRHNDRDSNSLRYDFVANPVIDKENNIWLKSPLSYINQFNINTGVARKFYLVTGAKIDEWDYTSYCKDAGNKIWISGYKAIYHYDYSKKKIEISSYYPDSMVCNFTNPMTSDPVTGYLWIGTRAGLLAFDPLKKVFFDSHFNRDKNPLFKSRSQPLKIFIDKQRNLWLSNHDYQLFRYNLKTHDFKQYNIPVILADGSPDKLNDKVTGIVQDWDGDIWISSYRGAILKYDSKSDKFDVAITQLYEKTSSNNTGVNALFIDKEDNIWVGTEFGVYIFNPRKQKIFSIENNPFAKLSFPARQVNAFYECSNGLIFVASREGGGVSIFDQQMHLVKRMFYRDDPASEDILGNWIWSFCEDKYGRLWMAGGNVLACYDLRTTKISTLKIPGMAYPVYAVISDIEGNLWLGGSQKIIKLNPLTGKYKIFSNLAIQFKHGGSEIRDLLIDKNQKFWVCTRYGLFRFDQAIGKYVECFIHSDNQPKNFSEDEIVCISEYDDHTLLLGTTDGLELFNTITKKFTHLKANDGNPSNVIQGISRDKEGNIFMDTFNGLYKVDATNHSYTRFGYDDGVLDNEFYTKIYKTHNGRLLAGGLNSFIYFNPEDLKETFTPPDVQLTGFKIFDKQLKVEPLLNKSNIIHLNADQNFITIQYASLYYYAPTDIHYYYKLDGVDKHWVNAGNARFATYTALDDGNYTFKVKASNDDGIACKTTMILHIHIAAPYYKSWWFILLCILGSMATVYAGYDYRARGRRNLSIMRRRIASDLHDDIGSTLNSISVYSEVAGQLLHSNTEKTKSILEKMGSASRSMIDNMNDIVWSINPKNDDFENILQRMQYFAGEILAAKNILLEFDSDDNMKKIKLPMDKRKNFYLIYKEAINNACKYSESKNVNVSLAEKDRHLIMIITDNGRGFDVPKNGLGGNGLKNMRARAKEIGGHFEINSWPGKGTRVFLKLRV